MNYLAIIVAALVPLVLGFIWYNPKVLGTAWMKESGVTEEKMKGANMPVIFGISLLLSIMLAFFIQGIVIHQMGAFSLTGGDVANALPSYEAFMNDYGSAFRTFKHGALHGFIAGLFFVFPIMATNGMYERKSWKLTFINVGYWTLTLMIMGSIICGWV
ncbi:DUF1761 domain-containing protein [Seonamhaeicola sp. MEBiC1930]|uniref:DUF1761 domain-containing protein n=1 Tax=Seonamhaeicola sp. MEBiC01930 TaxID=2976768 RepID=UPI003873B432